MLDLPEFSRRTPRSNVRPHGPRGGTCAGDAMPFAPAVGRSPQVTRRPGAAGTRDTQQEPSLEGHPKKYRCKTAPSGLAPASSDATPHVVLSHPIPCLTVAAGAKPPPPGSPHGRCSRCSAPGRHRTTREHFADTHAPTLPRMTAHRGRPPRSPGRFEPRGRAALLLHRCRSRAVRPAAS